MIRLKDLLFEQETDPQLKYNTGENPDALPIPDALLTKYDFNAIKTGINNRAQKNQKAAEQQAALQAKSSYDFLMTTLFQSSARSSNAKLWFGRMTQASRLQILDATSTWMQDKNNKKLAATPEQVNATIAQGDTNIKKIEAEANPSIAPIDIPFDQSGQTLYANNSAEMGEGLVTAINDWITTQVQPAITAAIQQNPGATATCTLLQIASSCSRLRNTGDYNGKTWNELSKDRATNVYNHVTGKLAEIGITVSPDVQQVLLGGFNNDGSSGPDCSTNFTFDSGQTTTQMSYSTTGADKLYGADSQRFGAAEYGGLMTAESQSHQYKFCKMLAKIIIAAKDAKSTEPSKIKTTNYSVIFNTQYSGKTPKLRTFQIPEFKVNTQTLKSDMTDCFRF